MLKNTKINRKGFTIIEVLIVLAIAGLILLVVLLAVPALQRNSRNTAVRNDASALAGGVNEFESNNNGTVPTQAGLASGVITLKTATIASGAQAKLQGGTTIQNVASGATATFAIKTPPVAGAQVAAGNLYVDTGENCQSVNGTAPTVSSRAVAVYFWTESPGVAAGADATTGIINGAGLKGQCVDS